MLGRSATGNDKKNNYLKPFKKLKDKTHTVVANITAKDQILYFKLSPCSVCCMLSLGNTPTSGVYMPTFRNTLCSIFIGR